MLAGSDGRVKVPSAAVCVEKLAPVDKLDTWIAALEIGLPSDAVTTFPVRVALWQNTAEIDIKIPSVTRVHMNEYPFDIVASRYGTGKPNR